MIGMIYCQHSPAGRYAIILYTVHVLSPAIQMHVSKCLSLLSDVATRRITFGTIATRNKNATHLLASASEKKIEVGLQSDRLQLCRYTTRSNFSRPPLVVICVVFSERPFNVGRVQQEGSWGASVPQYLLARLSHSQHVRYILNYKWKRAMVASLAQR